MQVNELLVSTRTHRSLMRMIASFPFFSSSLQDQHDSSYVFLSHKSRGGHCITVLQYSSKVSRKKTCDFHSFMIVIGSEILCAGHAKRHAACVPMLDLQAIHGIVAFSMKFVLSTSESFHPQKFPTNMLLICDTDQFESFKSALTV